MSRASQLAALRRPTMGGGRVGGAVQMGDVGGAIQLGDTGGLLAHAPDIAVGKDSGDPLGGALMGRAMLNRQASDYAASTAPTSTAGAPNILSSVLPDARWQGLLQAMSEQGVSDAPSADVGGFFQQQNPRNLQQQALVEQLRIQDANAQRDPTVLSRQQTWSQGVRR